MLSLIVSWRVLYAGDLTVLFSPCHAPASAPYASTVPALPAGHPLPSTGLCSAVFLSVSALAVAALGLSSNVAFQRGSLGHPCFVYQLWPSVSAVSVYPQFSLAFLPRSGTGVLFDIKQKRLPASATQIV